MDITRGSVMGGGAGANAPLKIYKKKKKGKQSENMKYFNA